MQKRVLVIDRSHLSKNIYSILLKKLSGIEITAVEDPEAGLETLKGGKKFDLMIFCGATVGGMKKDYLKTLKEVLPGGGPAILFVYKDQSADWKEFAGIKDASIIEKPFFPDDFIGKVRNLWGEK